MYGITRIIILNGPIGHSHGKIGIGIIHFITDSFPSVLQYIACAPFQIHHQQTGSAYMPDLYTSSAIRAA